MEYPRQLNLQTFEERQETDKWSVELVQKIHILEKQLEIAKEALEYYAQCKHLNLDILVMLLDKHKNEFADFEVYEDGETARKAVKEMEGVE